MNKEGHHMVVQERGQLEVRLPWAYAYPPGYQIVVERKMSGQILKREAYVNVAEIAADGEVHHRWERVK
jgi:hypothetical protein